MSKPFTIAGLILVGYVVLRGPWESLAMVNFGLCVAAFLAGANCSAKPVWTACAMAAVLAVVIYFAIPGFNRNTFGCVMALGIAIALAYGFWPLLAVFLPSLALSGSRGAIAATAVAFFVHFLKSYPALAYFCATGAVAAIVVFQPSTDSLYARFGVWQDTLNHLTLFGHGLGTYQDAYITWPIHRNMTGIIAPHAYNDLLEFLFELGIGALPLIFLFVIAFDKAEGPNILILLTGLILSLTYFPLHLPVLSHALAFALGQLARSPYALTLARAPSRT